MVERNDLKAHFTITTDAAHMGIFQGHFVGTIGLFSKQALEADLRPRLVGVQIFQNLA